MPNSKLPVETLQPSTLINNPGRYKNRSKQLEKLRDLRKVPAYLTANQQKIWKQLTKAVPAGVLKEQDGVMVEMATLLTEQLRQGTLKVSGMTQLRACLASLGCSPADRSRVPIPQPKEQTLDELLNLSDEEFSAHVKGMVI